MMRPGVRSPPDPPIFAAGLKRMYRFYCPGADFSKPSVVLTDAHEIHHIKDVLRLKAGAALQVFNARSQQADAVIEMVQEAAIRLSITSVKAAAEAGVKVILACVPPKKGKFEWIVEKCTELGVDEIIPLKAKRGEVIFTPERMQGKLKRFEAVAVNASKQSKRLKVTRIHPMSSLADVFHHGDSQGVRLIASLHKHPTHITQALFNVTSSASVTIFIGPEGDFTPDEVKFAVDNGCIPVSLGDTVLKVETAAICCVALVKFLCRN